jgi:AcrR family transcriptional regulator
LANCAGNRRRHLQVMKAASFAESARNQGKSERTRARLMDAAVGVFARDGFEGASVNEIARAADVVNGTFYLHFKDKNDIAAAVAFGIAADVTRQLDAAMAGIDDAAERTSCATRRFIEFLSVQTEWGLALWRAIWFFPELRANVVNHLRADLLRGRRQGGFTVEIDEFLVDTFISMMTAALFGRLQGRVGAEAGSKTAELQLRMLGVPAKKAKAVAWRKLPPLDIELPSPKT